MYPRLKLLHRLLADDGAIFISLDENEINELKLLLDEIFGRNNFVSTITLLCNPKGRSQDKYFGTCHEYVMVYSKTERPAGFFSVKKSDSTINKQYKLSDENGKYRLMGLRNSHREFNKITRPNLHYPLFVDALTGKVSTTQSTQFSIEVLPIWADGYEGCWTWGKPLAEHDAHLLVARKLKNSWEISRKSYSAKDGETVSEKLFTIWTNNNFRTEIGQQIFGDIFPNTNKTDFPQPKSVDLIKEIIRTCTNKDEIILDSFAGTGTTAHAVLKLNAEDVSNRRFILIETMDYAETITAERVRRVMNGYGEGDKTVAWLGGSFDYYTVGERLLLDDGMLNPAVGLSAIRDYVAWTEGIPIGQCAPLVPIKTEGNASSPYWLGEANNLGLFFVWDDACATTLDLSLLNQLVKQPGRYLIYADQCALGEDFMRRYNIIYKKIPRDITRL
jgi:adenine-specific DNA-methyltransferase